MPSIVIYELDNDPLNGNDTGVVAGFTVDITDDDAILEDPDSNGTAQFDVSGIPGLGNSNNFQIFESYDATVGGLPVTFTLIQFSGTLYMFATSGSIAPGDTLVAPNLTADPAAPNNYTDLPSYVCFADGTQILTSKGQILVEHLKVGDMVVTMDNDCQPIRWIGSRILDTVDLAQNPNLRPIRIRAGALGSGLPTQDLVVSPQHRVFVRSIVAQRIFGMAEILIPAKKLLDLDGIDVDLDAPSVAYNHFLFERHEIVFSNGAPTESMFTGTEALKSLGIAARKEITSLFPAIIDRGAPRPVRPIPQKGKMMKQFACRIQKNKKCVVEQAT